MEPQLEKIRDTQRETWNHSSGGWKKWDGMIMEFLRPVGFEMIRQLNLRPSDHILDIATGTGEPGLSIAQLLPQGKVIATDLAEEMLRVADEQAKIKGIRNFETIYSDATELPFADNTFDGVSCRHGFMFFPDMALALQEMIRVTRPGGRIVASVWNTSEKNSWICISMQTILERLEIKQPGPGAPGLFRCSAAGSMENLFSQAGLKEINSTEIPGQLPCDTIDAYRAFIEEVASPLAFKKSEPVIKQAILDEVMYKLKDRFPPGNLGLESNAQVIGGTK